MYASRVACCPLLSHAEYAPTGQTDKRTPQRYITLTDKRGQCKKVSLLQASVTMWYGVNDFHAERPNVHRFRAQPLSQVTVPICRVTDVHIIRAIIL